MSQPYDDRGAEPTEEIVYAPRRRRRSHRGPLLPTIWFCLLGVGWMALLAVILTHFLRGPWSTSDCVVAGLGVMVGVFYFWVAYAVYHRRRYIIDVAFAVAGLSLFQFPLGTVLAIVLLRELMSRRHDFTK